MDIDQAGLTWLSSARPRAAALTVPSTAWSYIENGTVRLGVIRDWGASIGYFSRVSPERNLVNHFDMGREVQQSYYGSYYPGVTFWGMPWLWNPVQAGDAFNNPSQVLAFTNDGSTIYARNIPKDWGLDNVDVDGYMEEWITLNGDVAKIHFKFTYTGDTAQMMADQELPAMFFDYALPNLVGYAGSAPWTNDSNLVRTIPPPLNTGWPTWMAAIGG
jgi:hypothetical protein